MPKPLPRSVAVLLYDGLCTFELGIVAEVFGLARPELGVEWYDMVTVSAETGPLRATGGVRMLADAGLERLEAAGTIVVPSWHTDGRPVPTELREAIGRAWARGARIVSICSGAFLLAGCGLLDGLRATTHWMYAEQLRRLHPRVDVDADVLYVDNGRILTSAGSAAGVDLLLHIVRLDHGAEIANQVARRMVMPPHREGGQAQFIARPVPPRPNGRLAPLLDEIRADPAADWSIAAMAARAAMSERTFVRRFREATGMAPGDWLVATRTETARYLLETDEAGLEQIAFAAGFGSVATFRHHFRARVGLTPSAYRRQYAPDRPAFAVAAE